MSLVEQEIPPTVARVGITAAREKPGRLVDLLLAEQGDLTAVERFSQFHSDVAEPLHERYYSALLPASPPGPGQQLAFEVDLEKCSGCKACVAACHSMNGLDEGETWRDVGLLIGTSASLPVLQHVTSACHHCLEPACLTACPVEAYEKDPVLGIVRHLDDQCIGCQYCTLACPYDVPKFNASKGIVRKCDMCSDRLRAGEAPACVQACPHEAIRIRVVDREAVRARADAGEFLPAAFDPAFTRPTTVFRGLGQGEHRAADEGFERPEHCHTPLVAMLVLTQLAAGGFLVELVARLAGREHGVAGSTHTGLSLTLGLVGLGASILHLGRPLYAYRAILGLRHSWLSREVMALGSFAKLAMAYVGAEVLLFDWLAAHPELRTAALAAVAASGAAGVGCSVMVYHAVRRPFWRASSSGVKFAGTGVILGLAVALASLGFASWREAGGQDSAATAIAVVALALGVATLAKLRFESADHRPVDEPGLLGAAARLLRGPLSRVVRARRVLGLAGGVALPALTALAADGGAPLAAAFAAALALGANLCGELLERSLFFAAASRPKMPGGLPS